MCSVICRVRMEFISCRVLRENIPHKPSPWRVGEGRGRLQTSWKTGDRTKTKGAPGLRPPSSSEPGRDHLTRALLVQRRVGMPSPRLGTSKLYLSSTAVFSVSAPRGAPWRLQPLQSGGWAYCSAGGPLQRGRRAGGGRSWVS